MHILGSCAYNSKRSVSQTSPSPLAEIRTKTLPGDKLCVAGETPRADTTAPNPTVGRPGADETRGGHVMHSAHW